MGGYMKYSYTKEQVRGVTYTYSAEWIHKLETEEHWRLYWNQQKLIFGNIRTDETILEIGVGSGFTANYLKSKGFNVETIDIDPEKKPDILSNIVTYNFQNRYDHVLAFEVFEHIPYSEFKIVLEKLADTCRKHLFLSVPRNERVWMQFNITLPFIGTRTARWVTLRRKVVEPAHFWEIDDGSVSMAEFENTLKANRFMILTRRKCFSRLFYALSSGNA